MCQSLDCTPLTTPEQAQAFLAEMRERQNQRDPSHKPPSTMSADSMEAWYLQQKQRERELRQRRLEAEAILRGYRGDATSVVTYGKKGNSGSRRESSESSGMDDVFSSPIRSPYGQHRYITGTPLSHNSGLSRESLDDPHHFKLSGSRNNYDTVDDDKSLYGQVWSTTNRNNAYGRQTIEEEKKVDDEQFRRSFTLQGQHQSTKTPPSMLRPIPDLDLPQVDDTPQDDKEITLWLDFISSEPGAKFPPEAGRYHLYLSYACPGSHRVLIVRALKGLQDCVSVTYVHPAWRLTRPDDVNDKHRGWVFGDPNGIPFPNTIGRGGPFPPAYEGNDPDPIFNAYSIREIYENAKDTSGKYTIPFLWDKKLNTIVNNESSDIAYMLNSCFNDFARNPELDLYTEYDDDGVAKLNEVSEWLAPLMIHGVYRCGFAKTQRAYNRAVTELCEAFDRADDILQQQRFLTGDTLTDADIRLFVSLIRFDEVYAIYFKANARLVMLTPSLLNFCRDLYQMPGVAETCNMEQIKAHFFGSHAEWNKYSVIPRGLGFMELLAMPHQRYLLSDEQGNDRKPMNSYSEC